MSTEIPTISFDDFTKLDLRVGIIKSAEAIPKKDKLVKLEVDLGELGMRTIVAGIVQHYHPDRLVQAPHNSVVVITNLEPRKVGGIMSHGMLLAAIDVEDRLNLVTARTVHAGTKVG